MKLLTLLSLSALAAFAHAETTLTMTGVHNCCKGCANGITKAGTSVGDDIAVVAEGKTVTITTKKKADAKKAVEAIIAAGYFGKVEGEEVAAATTSSTKPESTMAKATVSGVHLCCKKCVTAVEDALKSINGVSKYEVVSKAESFTVEGEFTKSALASALNSAGFAGDIK